MPVIVTTCDADHFFANAGQAEVERALVRALIDTGSVQLRIVTVGNSSQIDRLRSFCDRFAFPNSISISQLASDAASEVLVGAHGFLQHSLPLGFSAWFDKLDVVNSIPTVTFVHSMLCLKGEIDLWCRTLRNWKGHNPICFVAPSRCTAARFANSGALTGLSGTPELVVIPHATNKHDLSCGSRLRGRKLLGIPEDSVVLLSLARISPEKYDCRQLLFAFYSAMKTGLNRNAILVIAGGYSSRDDGYLQNIRDDIRRLSLAPHVRLAIHFADCDKADILMAADVLLCLGISPQESFGLALLEGLAVGLPIVATDWNGFREVLSPEFAPYLLPTVASHKVAQRPQFTKREDLNCLAAVAIDFHCLADALRCLICDRALREHLALLGKRITWNLSWATVAHQVLQLWTLLSSEGYQPSVRREPLSTLQSVVDGLGTHYLNAVSSVRLSRWPEAVDPLALDFQAIGDEQNHLLPTLISFIETTGECQLSDIRRYMECDDSTVERLVIELLRVGVIEITDNCTSIWRRHVVNAGMRNPLSAGE